jgi:hypothetical protein
MCHQKLENLVKKSWKILSSTQAQLIDYINENINNSNRIIIYKHIGHFGLEYAILSRFKNAEIINLKQLKTKKGKNLLFRLLHIVAAIGAFLLNESKDTDMRTTITTILSNMENIYLGIDKEKEYLKYLHIKKLAHKDDKIKFFIRIEEKDIETEEDVQCFKLLSRLIESKKINNTVLLISGEKVNLLNLGIKREEKKIPVFQLQESDLDIIAKENELTVTETVGKNIDLIQKLGLQFFIDNYFYFDALSEITAEKFDWLQKMDWLINQISKRNGVSTQPLYSLLEFSSFFENSFSKIEIQNFNNNELDVQNLDVAKKLALVTQEKTSNYTVPTYFFSRNAFKIYFATKYISDLEPIPKMIYLYFRKHYPFKYIPALNVLHIDSSFVDYKEKQSITIVGYYFQNYERGICNVNDFIRLTTKNSTASIVINMFEYFKFGSASNVSVNLPTDMSVIINKLKSDTLDVIASCASYVIILQLLKEDYLTFSAIKFGEILGDFCSAILRIDNKDDYYKYWQMHFKCQYIALSLEDEATKRQTAKRFLDDIKRNRNEENFTAYISDNLLRGFSRIDLLAYSLGYDNAGEILHGLYVESEESTILKELARINYSAYLIENGYFSDAEKILKEGDVSFLENINVDTYCGYINNLYLARLINKTLNINDFILTIENTISKNINFNDKLIIQNNLAVAYLIDDKNESRGLMLLYNNFEMGNVYNRFLAIHNLLSYYYTQNDSTNFNSLYDKICVPKLFLSDKTFFINKLKWMKENIGHTTYENFKYSASVPQCYNLLYLFGTIERWFE